MIVTSHYVLMTKPAAIEVCRRLRAARELRAELQRERALLHAALIELAQERGSIEAQRDARRWRLDHRAIGEAAAQPTTENLPSPNGGCVDER